MIGSVGRTLLSIILLLLCFAPPIYGKSSRLLLKTQAVQVAFDASYEARARRIAAIYPKIASDLTAFFGWRLNAVPLVVLVGNRRQFLMMTNHPITVAYAVPSKQLIVIDASRVADHPFSFETTLRHELCHLFLHRKIKDVPLWLDEGVAQYTSGGLDEILVGGKRDALNRAALTRRFIPFRRLDRAFPQSESDRILAYAQSKSFVTFLINSFGIEKFKIFLNKLSLQPDMNIAFESVFSIGFSHVEKKWQRSFHSVWTWMVYFSHHLYSFAFFFTGLAAVVGFVKMKIRKKRMADKEDWE